MIRKASTEQSLLWAGILSTVHMVAPLLFIRFPRAYLYVSLAVVITIAGLVGSSQTTVQVNSIESATTNQEEVYAYSTVYNVFYIPVILLLSYNLVMIGRLADQKALHDFGIGSESKNMKLPWMVWAVLAVLLGFTWTLYSEYKNIKSEAGTEQAAAQAAAGKIEEAIMDDLSDSKCVYEGGKGGNYETNQKICAQNSTLRECTRAGCAWATPESLVHG